MQGNADNVRSLLRQVIGRVTDADCACSQAAAASIL
jgi:hypothetical protein